MVKKSANTLIKIVTATTVVFVIVILALGLLPMILGKSVSNLELKKIALTYAKERCRADTKKKGTFCDNLVVTLGSATSDSAGTMWSAYVNRKDTNQLYSSFMIKSSTSTNNRPEVDERTYVLNET